MPPATPDRTAPLAGSTLADKLLRPRRVAIVGASGDPARNNSRPQRYLRKHGFRGAIYPINPNYTELFGEPCYPSLAATPQPADHAYVMVPPRAVEGVIRECGATGVAVASIFSGGFAEAGDEGRRRQDRLLAVAREANVRLLGPNSLGVLNTNWPLTLSANAVLERPSLPKGRIGLVSQSGGMLGALVSRGQARGIHFSALVSIGNEADLSVGEVAAMLVDDADTDVILLFLETLRDPERVAAMALRAFDAGKPVIAYVLGRSELGQTLAQSHTGAMLGQTRALDAFLRSAGIMRVDHFEALLETPALVKGRRPLPPLPAGTARRRVAIATTTGGAAALVADNLGLRGFETAGATEQLIADLAKLGLDIQPAPIVDLTMAGTRPEVVDTAMAGFMADDRVDAILMTVGSSSEYHPELCVTPLAKWAGASKPVVSFLLPDAQRSLQLLAAAGIAGFRTPEACADALAAYLAWQPPRATVMGTLPVSAAQLLQGAGAGARLNEQDALGLFASLGVPVPRMAVLRRPEDAAGAALTFPVVAKILSPDIAHKSDVGGVRLGIATPAALAEAVRDLLANVPARAPGARIDGVVVQEMATGLAEAIVGFRHDPLVGPIIAVGAGGILAEVYGDIAVRPAPVDVAEAMAMLDEVKGFAPLRGFRGLPLGDLPALAAIVAAVSRLALSPVPVAEAEINPVLVRGAGHGAIAVDGLVHFAAPPGTGHPAGSRI